MLKHIIFTSDLLLMKDCATIMFGDIQPNPPEVRAVVWRRKNISRSLNITEKKLVELAICTGNDFTSSIDTGLGNRNISQILSFLQAQPDDFEASAHTDEENLALLYSRDFYNLEDLSQYPVDREAIRSPLSLEEFLQKYCGRLDDKDRKELLSYHQSRLNENVPNVIFHYLEESSTSSSEPSDSVASSLITPDYRVSLKTMIDEMANKESDLLEASHPRPESEKKKKKLRPIIDLSWKDIVVFDVFGCLLKQLLRNLLKALSNNCTSRYIESSYLNSPENNETYSLLLQHQVLVLLSGSTDFNSPLVSSLKHTMYLYYHGRKYLFWT